MIFFILKFLEKKISSLVSRKRLYSRELKKILSVDASEAQQFIRISDTSLEWGFFPLKQRKITVKMSHQRLRTHLHHPFERVPRKRKSCLNVFSDQTKQDETQFGDKRHLTIKNPLWKTDHPEKYTCLTNLTVTV